MKSRSIIRILCASGFALLLLLLAQTSARADEFSVTVDTTSLIGASGGPFQVGLALFNPSGTPDAGNTAVITGFDFGGGSGGAVDSALTVGDATGDFISGFTLTDSTTLNGIAAYFTPGDSLSFNVTMTTVDPDDEFALLIFDAAGDEIATTNSDDFLEDATPVVGGGVTTTTYSIVPAPEPGSLLLLSCGLAALLGLGLMGKRPVIA
jgi:hypothetical protein